MYQQMLKNQRVTFVSDVEQAEKISPYYMTYNRFSDRYVVMCKRDTMPIVAAGLSKEDAEAAVMFHANQYILRNVQKGA